MNLAILAAALCAGALASGNATTTTPTLATTTVAPTLAAEYVAMSLADDYCPNATAVGQQYSCHGWSYGGAVRLAEGVGCSPLNTSGDWYTRECQDTRAGDCDGSGGHNNGNRLNCGTVGRVGIAAPGTVGALPVLFGSFTPVGDGRNTPWFNGVEYSFTAELPSGLGAAALRLSVSRADNGSTTGRVTVTVNSSTQFSAELPSSRGAAANTATKSVDLTRDATTTVTVTHGSRGAAFVSLELIAPCTVACPAGRSPCSRRRTAACNLVQPTTPPPATMTTAAAPTTTVPSGPVVTEYVAMSLAGDYCPAAAATGGTYSCQGWSYGAAARLAPGVGCSPLATSGDWYARECQGTRSGDCDGTTGHNNYNRLNCGTVGRVGIAAPGAVGMLPVVFGSFQPVGDGRNTPWFNGLEFGLTAQVMQLDATSNARLRLSVSRADSTTASGSVRVDLGSVQLSAEVPAAGASATTVERAILSGGTLTLRHATRAAAFVSLDVIVGCSVPCPTGRTACAQRRALCGTPITPTPAPSPGTCTSETHCNGIGEATLVDGTCTCTCQAAHTGDACERCAGGESDWPQCQVTSVTPNGGSSSAAPTRRTGLVGALLLIFGVLASPPM